MSWILAGLLGLFSSPASAWSVGVVAGAKDGPINNATVQSAVWHALRDERGHDALILAEHLGGTHDRMVQERLTSLYAFEVSWRAEARMVDGGILADDAPVVRVTELRVTPGGYEEVQQWEATAPLVVYRTGPSSQGEYLVLPEIALQQAMSQAVQKIPPVTWQSQETRIVTVPLEVCGDDAWREHHGDAWQDAARRRVDHASKLLGQAGLVLEIASYCEWNPAPDKTLLSDLLPDLADLPLRDGRIKLGLTARPVLTGVGAGIEDVGRAYQPGRHVVIADQPRLASHSEGWDVAEEGVAIAHELLHALGLPHNDHPHFLMSRVKRGSVHVLSPSTRSLARAAAEARYAHWDPVAALVALASAAERWIDDPDMQLDYVAENLARGPGVPMPGQVSPLRISALGNVAITRHWLADARRSPEDGGMRQTLIAHGRAALAEHPNLVQPMLEALRATSPPTPATSLDICVAGQGTWDTTDCPEH